MKRNMLTGMICSIGVIVLAAGIGLLATGCKGETQELQPLDPAGGNAVNPTEDTVLPGDSYVNYNGITQLICIAGSEEEAKEIAEQYGITFLRFNAGIATFETSEDPQEVMQRGIDNGWTELSLNHIYQLSPIEKPTNRPITQLEN